MLKGSEFADLKREFGDAVDNFADGKFGTNIRKAQEKLTSEIDVKSNKFDDLLKNIDETNAPGTLDDISVIIENKMNDDLYDIPRTEYDAAKEELLKFIQSNQKSNKLSGENIRDLKHQMTKANNLFKTGTAPSEQSKLRDKVYAILYHEINDKMGEVSPEARKLATELKEHINLNSAIKEAIDKDKTAANIHPIHMMILFGSAMSASPTKIPGLIISGAQVGKGIGRTLPAMIGARAQAKQLGQLGSQIDAARFLGAATSRARGLNQGQ